MLCVCGASYILLSFIFDIIDVSYIPREKTNLVQIQNMKIKPFKDEAPTALCKDPVRTAQ